MRLFTALDLPDPVRDRLGRVQVPNALDARWTPPSQFHVTLRFIGDTDAAQVTQYETALQKIEADPVQCIPYGLDVLPSRRNPSVLILGLERTDDLVSLYTAVSGALETHGLAPEDRTYRPHVTMARLGDLSPTVVHHFINEHEPDSLPSFTADAFHLYESTLSRDGAIHERRASFPLREA